MASLVARLDGHRADVTRHKRAIAFHRRELKKAATALAECEARCRDLGIALVYPPLDRVEDCPHGDRPDSDS